MWTNWKDLAFWKAKGRLKNWVWHIGSSSLSELMNPKFSFLGIWILVDDTFISVLLPSYILNYFVEGSCCVLPRTFCLVPRLWHLSLSTMIIKGWLGQHHLYQLCPVDYLEKPSGSSSKCVSSDNNSLVRNPI